MLCVDAVTVVCDRCGRPGWRLEVSELNGEVVIDGTRLSGADGSRYWSAVLRGRGAHRYPGRGARPGAFIVPADGPAAFGSRDKLVCIGRKHPRYERVVTQASAERSYRAAVAAGRTSIGMREVR
jgi:hypothetical protein